MRKLASIVEIASCDPILETDRLSVATMTGKGWRVVTGRDEFKAGDKAVYFEIDSFLNADDDRFDFLRERCLRKFVTKSGQVLRSGIRIKTCKLRGVVSQGLLMPVGKFAKELADAGIDILVGADLTDILHVEHYDEIAEALRPSMGVGNPVAADAMGPFPSTYIPKTDEERIQNLGDYFTTMKGRLFEVTEKNDGSSVTMFYSKTIDAENPFGVCSRNLRLKPKTESGVVPVAWQVAQRYDMESKIRATNEVEECEYAFQGELVGPGINCNRDLYKDYEWHVFKVWDITHQKFLPPWIAQIICEARNIPYVYVVEKECDVFNRFTTMDELLKFAEGKTVRGNEREGLVFKSCEEPYVSFKVVSNKYLMKENN